MSDMVMDDLKKRAAGARAAKSGESFEKELARAHDVYAELGLASIQKLPVPTAPMSGAVMNYAVRSCGDYMRGMLRTRVRRQNYDFVGAFGPNAGPDLDPGAWHGLSIAMEAKHSSSEKTSLPIVAATSGKKGQGGGGGLSEHQLNALADAYESFGTIAVLVWRNGDQRLILTPDRVRMARAVFAAGGRKSIPAGDFTPYDLVPYPEAPRVEDWLYTVRTWLEVRGRPSPALSPRKAYRMIEYRLDVNTRTVDARPEGVDDPELVVENAKLIDRRALDDMARTADSPKEFVELVRRWEIAND